jgi:hypothetical protein
MNESKILTRPVRAAASATGRSEEELEGLVRSASVAMRFESSAADNASGRNIGLAGANQILRFCPNLSVVGADDDLLTAISQIGRRIHGSSHEVVAIADAELVRHTCVLNIGTEARAGSWITVNSNEWLTRLATGVNATLPEFSHVRNAIGEVGAACRGVGEVFKCVVGLDPVPILSEQSLLTYRESLPGDLDPGIALPSQPAEIDAFLIGCGAVMNGWAYVVGQLPIEGRAEAVDKQSLRSENIGPYVASGREWLRRRKVDLISDVLGPRIRVTPRADEFEFFKIHLHHGLHVPPLIVSGLDNPDTRRSVQRLWPTSLVDMAAGGWSSQVIVKQDGSRGQCVLDAFTATASEGDYADELSRETGISADAIRDNPTGLLTDEIVNAAPPEKRRALRKAKGRGQRVCGRVMEHNLDEERDNPNFAPAVPFATCFSGVVAAAETMKVLLGQTYDQSVHYQHSFQSRRGRLLRTSCQPDCECRRRAAA